MIKKVHREFLNVAKFLAFFLNDKNIKQMKTYRMFFVLLAIAVLAGCNASKEENTVYVPQISGAWWQVAGNPNLGECTSEKQQPVDFGIWQAADGTWQLWSCIRHTKCGKHTRLFYRWEGESLTDPNWKPMGIAMQADTTLGEKSGGLQAPHVIKENGTYYMFYGDWQRICLAKSQDGKHFERVINEDGNPALFKGPYNGTRDAMVLKDNDQYYCYYMGNNRAKEIRSAIFCRTSKDMKNWSEPAMVYGGGTPAQWDTSTGMGLDAESPHVVNYQGKYILFSNQVYGKNMLNTQYCSDDPLYFGVNTDSLMINTLPVAAPEIIEHEGQYYIASLVGSLDGIKIAKLEFEPKPREAIKVEDLFK